MKPLSKTSDEELLNKIDNENGKLLNPALVLQLRFQKRQTEISEKQTKIQEQQIHVNNIIALTGGLIALIVSIDYIKKAGNIELYAEIFILLIIVCAMVVTVISIIHVGIDVWNYFLKKKQNDR